MIQVIADKWWFIALLGVIMILSAPLFSMGIHRLRLDEAMRNERVYRDHAIVRAFIDRPALTIVGLGFIQILIAAGIGRLG